jgi:hypothetical protein
MNCYEGKLQHFVKPVQAQQPRPNPSNHSQFRWSTQDKVPEDSLRHPESWVDNGYIPGVIKHGKLGKSPN